MPVLIPIVAAIAGAAAGFGVASAVGLTVGSLAFALVAGVVGTAVSLGVTYAANAVFGAPKQNVAPQADTGADRRQLIRSSVAPRQVVYGRARVSGPLIYASSSGADQRYLHLIVPIAGHALDGIDAIWINDNWFPWSSVDGSGYILDSRVSIEVDGAQHRLVRARFYDGRQTGADADLVAESADGWSADHIGYGVAYLYVRLEYDQEKFPSGVQNISAEVRGKRIYDPRSGAEAWAENGALCVLDYLRSTDGMGCDLDEIDMDSFVTAANVCDEGVQIDAAGAVQPRYHIGGSFGLDRTPLDVVDEMLAGMGGTLVYVAGEYRIHAGAYEAPTDTLTTSDMAGPIELVTKPARREVFNAVRGKFINPPKGWQESDFPPVSNAAAIAEDGETIWRDITFPFTIDAIRAQRLAMLALLRARQGETLRVPVQYRGIRYSVWQSLAVTIPEFGYSSKPFRITSWTFDPESGVVMLTLREETSAAYAWTYDLATEASANTETTLVSPFVVPAPAGLAVTEELFVAQGGAGVQTRAILTWAAAQHPFVSRYEVQFREASASEWRIGIGSHGETRAEVDGLADGIYTWRVRARTTVAAGAWATTQARIGLLAAQAPSAVTGLAVQSIGGLAFLRWDQHPEIDVRVGGKVEFRHAGVGTAATWAASTSIGDAVPGDATWTVLPLKAGTYLVKAVDAGGRYSAAASIGSTQATALAYANVDSIDEHTAFSGTGAGTVVTDDTLRLDTSGDIDAEADFDAITDVDGLGGVLTEGTYDFNAGIDLLSVQNIRLTSAISAIIVNTFSNVDSRADSVDDWLDWDEVAGNEADAWVEVRQTDDDPSGTPTWGSWARLDASEFRARAFEFRAQLRSYDPAYNIHVSELTATADEVA